MPDLQPDLINGWNCSFTKDLTQLRTLPLNPATKMELLAGEEDISVVSELYFIISSHFRIFPVRF